MATFIGVFDDELINFCAMKLEGDIINWKMKQILVDKYSAGDW